VTPCRPWIAACAAAALAAAGPALAECGLAQCPARDAESPAVCVSAYAQHTSFDLGDPGDYTLGAVRIRWDAASRLCLSAVTSWVDVRTDGGEAQGRRNPVFLGEVKLLAFGDRRVFSGLQWETPWGDDLVSAPHSELLGWLRCIAGSSLDVIGGYRFSASDGSSPDGGSPSAAPPLTPPDGIAYHAGHAHSASTDFAALVNPHEARELLWSVEAAPIRNASVTVQGQHPVSGATSGEHFVTLGASAAIPVHRHLSIRPSASGPVSQSRRYDWTVGLELSVR
jgi:hypothetical protein